MGAHLGKACVTGDSQRYLEAVKQGDADAVASKVAGKPSLLWAARLGTSNTAWHVAAKHGQANVLRALAHRVKTQGPLSEKQMKSLETHIALTAMDRRLARCSNTPDGVLAFLVNQRNAKGQTPLMLACAYGHAACVSVLLAASADPWVVDRQYHNTCLHYAAQHGQAECVMRLFDAPIPSQPSLEFGTPSPTGRFIDYRNQSGFSALHYAVWSGRYDAVHALLLYAPDMRACSTTAGADWVNVKEGCTVLHLSVMKGDIDIVRELVKAIVEDTAARRPGTVDPRTLCNCYGVLPYDLAIMHGRWRMAAMLAPGRDIHDLLDVLLDGSLHGRRARPNLGPPKLASLAAAALQRQLMNTLQFTEYELQGGADDAGQAAAGSRAALIRDPKTAKRMGLDVQRGVRKGAKVGSLGRWEDLEDLEELEDEALDQSMKGKAIELGRNAKRVMPVSPASPPHPSSAGFLAASTSAATSAAVAAAPNWWYDKTVHGGATARPRSSDLLERSQSSGDDAREYLGALGGAFDDDLLGGGEQGADEGCGICFSSSEQVVVSGCGHKLCVQCAREIIGKHKYQPATCPFCRGLIRGFATDPAARAATKPAAKPAAKPKAGGPHADLHPLYSAPVKMMR